MKKLKTFSLAICAVLVCCACALACMACGDKEGNDEAPPITNPVRTAPTLTVNDATLTGTVGVAVTLPAATALDEEDGDISAQVKVQVYFDRDYIYVYPEENPQEGAAGNITNSFTPTKVGEYQVIYNVKNSANKSARKTVTLTVGASSEARTQQYVANKEQWVFSEDGAGGEIDEYGYISLAAGHSAPSVAYGGKKIKSGDSYSIRFNATADGTMFYVVGAHMSGNYAVAAPDGEEGVLGNAKRLAFRILSSKIEPYFASISNKNLLMSCGELNEKLLDGKDHTLSVRNTLITDGGEKKIKTEIWIDAPVSSSPKYTSEITETAALEYYGQQTFDAELADMFDEDKFGGWFNLGAWRNGSSDDVFALKALTFNEEAYIETPKLVTSAPEASYVKDSDIAFEAATAEDGNDYENITSRIKITVTKPNGDKEELDGNTFTPDMFGRHSIRYYVTDRSGNIAYADYEFSVSKGASTVAPTITLRGETENITVNVGETVTVPAVESAIDSFGDDVLEFVEISLIGAEAKSLAAVESVTLYSAGKHYIRYSVTDYNNLTTVLEVPVTVINDKTDISLADFYMTNNTEYSELFGVGLGGLGYAHNKIYSEKVRVLLDLNVATAWNSGDGINWVEINMRGGKSLDYAPGTNGFNSFGWPNGLIMEVCSEGICIKSSGHDSEQLGIHAFNAKEYFAKGLVEVAWQVTDLYSDGEFIGVKIEVWLDGKVARMDSTVADRDGNLVLSTRLLGSRPELTKAGWLTFARNGGSIKEAVIKGITIDGSAPVFHTMETVPADENVTVYLDDEYTLPVLTLKYGTQDDLQDLSSQVQKFICKNGETEDYTTPFMQNTLTVSNEYIAGFKVMYRYNNVTIKTVSVNVSAEAKDIVWQGEHENLGATLGEEFAYPVITSFKMGATTITDGIVTKLGYKDTSIALKELSGGGTFTPSLNKDIVLYYFYGENVVATLDIAVSGETAQGNILDSATVDGQHIQYTAQKVYDEKMSLKIKLNANNVTDGATTGMDWNNVGKLLNIYLRPTNSTNALSAIKLTFFVNGAMNVSYHDNYTSILGCLHIKELLNTDTDEQIVTYMVEELYNDSNELTGIQIHVWINGKKVEWDDYFKYAGYELSASDLKAGIISDANIQKISAPSFEGADGYDRVYSEYNPLIQVFDSAKLEMLEWRIDGTECTLTQQA
ncbi:DUF5011 domain-containing protein [Pumilibacter intestinalis]|uniref:DUF5011 domain-containing protein n=1 Tax=Pumilibacter intestinalis TaxID=2941511 RepID=UPI00203BC2D2|nr:DUF5011 domain-containing protein [Pumilibacter intestinalis]